MKTQNYKLDAIGILKELIKKYPRQLLSQHLSLAFADYGNKFDNISDKELYYILEKYKCEKELDIQTYFSDDITSILKDGMDLNLEDEEEDY